MAKFKIELKQHTPLIHFQSEQPGAILRATEVKPKLDKFLIEYVFNNKFDEYKQYLIGYKADKKDKIEEFNGKEAFDYKLRIYVKYPDKIRKINIKGAMKKLYFAGGMNGGKENGIFTNEDIILEFFTFHEKLIDGIKENIEKFFCFNNFGTRQNKGFGSFYIKNDLENQFINGEKWFQNKIKINYKKKYKNENDLWQEMFNKIDDLYRRIRSEEKSGTPYIKEFFRSKGIKWEKDTIRNKFVYGKKESVENIYLIKDLLGLSVDERWEEKSGKKFNVKKECIGKKEDKIERMKSPIFFKPLKDKNGDFEIYIKANDIPKEFFNKTFKIRKWINQKNVDKIQLNTLKIASSEDVCEVFNINEFIKFIKDKGEIESTSCENHTRDSESTNSNIKKTSYKNNKDNNKNFNKECVCTIAEAMDFDTMKKLKLI
ncbi:hypothetical protein [Clostridium sp. Marseille-Q2269]|uniref:hypothetical protein n=1 Tax=Clostridium sp. Marseille-Q2269 TaxID=2942205 RepID=UPI002073A611|nr:hypothetical protein [Clostridium sp. Marseille-Q2269]